MGSDDERWARIDAQKSITIKWILIGIEAYRTNKIIAVIHILWATFLVWWGTWLIPDAIHTIWR